MNRLEMLAQRLGEAWSGPAWHGPALLEVLGGLTPAQAASRPIPGAHSIWELALHCAAWQRIVARRLLGDDRPPTEAENFPPVPAPTQAGWNAALDELRAADATLRAAVLAGPASRLDPEAQGFDPRLHQNVLGAIAHLTWHGGQIALLRRAQGLAPVHEPAGGAC